jgi:hypothetical protein
MTPEEATDRLAIRELIDGYSHCADRRDCDGQIALFTEDTRFLVFMDAQASTPSQTITRSVDLRPIFEALRMFEATTHFNGQSTVQLNDAVATGETYCLAHHVQVQDGKRSLWVTSIRYLDTFVKQAGRWLFSERRLMVDWVETRPL